MKQRQSHKSPAAPAVEPTTISAASSAKPTISPEVEKHNREYRLISKRWNQQIREGRPVARALAAEARTWLDEVLSSGDRAVAKAAICTLSVLRDLKRVAHRRN